MDNLYDLIIIGGGPAGLSAAIYAGRAKLKTLIIDKEQGGGQIKITSEVVNYPGITKISGADLIDSMKKQVESFGVSFAYENVINVELNDDIKIINTENNSYKTVGVIIATGARPRKLGFEGEDIYNGRGIGYCATCDGEFFTGLDIFVVGGGFAAAEEAIFLTRYAKQVHIIVRDSEFTSAKSLADKVLANKKIEVHFNTEMLKIDGDDLPRKITFKNTTSNETWIYNAEENKTFGTFIFVGYEPISDVFTNKVTLNESGYIPTNENLETNISGVYAAGDIRPKNLRQLVTATSDGAISATNIERYITNKKTELNIETKTQEHNHSHEHKAVFISDEIKEQLTPLFNSFKTVPKIVTIVAQDENSEEVKEFVTDFSKTTDKVKVEIYNKGEKPELEKELNPIFYPVIAIYDSENNYTGIKFHGTPSGHEFNSFIASLYNVAGPGQEIDKNLIEEFKKIDKKTNLKIGVSLSCTLCPEMVMRSHALAKHNKNVEAEMIDIMKFPEFKDKYNIMSVPVLILNDKVISFGKKTFPELLSFINEN